MNYLDRNQSKLFETIVILRKEKSKMNFFKIIKIIQQNNFNPFNRNFFLFYVIVLAINTSFACDIGIEEAFGLSKDIMESRYRDSSLRLSVCERCLGDKSSFQVDTEDEFVNAFPNLQIRNKKEFLSQCMEKTAPLTEMFKLLASLLETAHRNSENATQFYKHAAFQVQKRSEALETITKKLKQKQIDPDKDFLYASLSNHINDYRDIMNLMAPYATDKELTEYNDDSLEIAVTHYTPQQHTEYIQVMPLSGDESSIKIEDQKREEETTPVKKKKRKKKKNIGNQEGNLSSDRSYLLQNQEIPPQLASGESKAQSLAIEKQQASPTKSRADAKEEGNIKPFTDSHPDEKMFEKKTVGDILDDKKKLSQESVSIKAGVRLDVHSSSDNVKSPFEQQWSSKKKVSHKSEEPLVTTPEPIKKIVSLRKEKDYKSFLAIKEGKGVLLERALKGIVNKFNLRISSHGKTGSERNVFYNQRRIAIIHEPPPSHKLDKLSLELLSYGFNKYVLEDFNVTN